MGEGIASGSCLNKSTALSYYFQLYPLAALLRARFQKRFLQGAAAEHVFLRNFMFASVECQEKTYCKF